MSEETKVTETPVVIPAELPEEAEIPETYSEVIMDYYQRAVNAKNAADYANNTFQEFIGYVKTKLKLPLEVPYGVTPDAKKFVRVRPPVASENTVQSSEQPEQPVTEAEIPKNNDGDHDGA